MTQYLDSSALVKLYVAESDAELARERIEAGYPWVTARHSLVEVRRTLARVLAGGDLADAREAFSTFWERLSVIELVPIICSHAAEIAELHLARSLDAMHLAAADALGTVGLVFHTYDSCQAAVARSIGFTVLGAD